MGGRLVQFGIAVSRKPAIAAITKPKSISWICQLSGSNRLGNAVPVANMTIQSASAAAAQSPAARKNGRKPWVRNTGVPRPATPLTALLIARRRSPPAPLVRRG